jgi:two-component system sensor histidine kinase/response regulator
MHMGPTTDSRQLTRQALNPARLLIEILAIVALAQVAVATLVPSLAPALTGPARLLMDAALLVLLVGPWTYWRCISPPRAAAASPERRAGRQRVQSAIAMTAAAQLLGLALTAGGVLWLQRTVEATALVRFERGVERIHAEVLRRFEHSLDGLKGARGAYAASALLQRHEFRAYVESRELENEFPGVRGFGFVERVLREDLARFVAAERADGAPEFTVQSSGDASDLYVVKYIEPLADNRAALGYDLGQDPVRRKAAERAVHQPTLSARLTLLQDDKRGAGFLYLIPVYKRGSSPAGPKEREQFLAGLLYVPIEVAELVNGVADATAVEGSLEFQLFENDAGSMANLLFDSGDRLSGAGAGALFAARTRERLFGTTRSFDIGGQALALRIRSTPAFEAAIDRSSVSFALVGGVFGSFLLALTVWLLASGRARAQNAARRMTADLDRLAQVVRRTTNAVIITDAHNRIAWVNEGFTRISGYTLADASGREPGELLSSGKSDPAALQVLAQATAAGQACRVELINRAKDGRDYWFDVDRQPIRSEQGALLGFMEIDSDISASKQAEVRLQDALARAEEASLSKGQFLANMSHEIRTPMNAILGMLKLLQTTELSTRQLDYASKAEGAARSLLRLLNDILDFSKVEAGKMTLDLKPFRVDQLLRDLSVILSASVGAKDLEVLFDIDPTLPQCLVGDDMRLRQVLINLGGNAIKFTPEGLVILSLQVLERGARDVLLEFSMRDSGIGIAPENQAHIFSGFSQAEASTTRRFGGTGLGLAICQRLVGLMGGEIRIESALGQGSRFTFQLRLALGDAQVETESQAQRLAAGGLRALVVDDNATARELLVRMARSLGWQADAAASGEQAIELVQQRAGGAAPYQLILLDWQMPGLDGWQTSRRIRQMPAGEAKPPLLVMVTAQGREMLTQRSAREQALLNGFLVKPVTASMLFDAVADARAELAHPALTKAPVAQRVRRLDGMRLLVVEDNRINQQVADELLTREGALVTLADNGQLGVAAVAAAEPMFDAVLMDIQMPVLDGYGATAQIRHSLGLGTLPIIAMTANAMASDREACLAAGMNDHVGKPFDLDHLVALLQRHCGRAVPVEMAPAQQAAGAPSAPAEQRAATAPGGIDLAGALARLGGDSDLYRRLLGSFLNDMATLMPSIKALLPAGQPGDRVEAGRLLHTIKGLAATLGVQDLSQVAGQAERQLGAAGTPFEPWLDRVQAAVQRAQRDLANLLRELDDSADRAAPVAGAELPDAEEWRAGLIELSALLRAADMQALEQHARLRQSLAAHLSEEAMRPLDEAMAALDFEQALACCHALTTEPLA